MIHGLDTGFLVALEITSDPFHKSARIELERIVKAKERLALAPQVLLEFIHVATDAKRFQSPLNMTEAREIADTKLLPQPPHRQKLRLRLLN